MAQVPQGNPFRVDGATFPEQTHNIAITWGSSWGLPFFERSCALSQYLPLMKIPRAAYYSVQKSHHRNQLHPPPQGIEVQDLAPHISDFYDTARVLMGVDAVVTTDNVVANLACVLQRPVFVLVPKASDWRWGIGGRTPWYPSARVYQQRAAGQWAEPIAALTSDLQGFLANEARTLPKPEPSKEPTGNPSLTQWTQQVQA
jgi:hypothetical protein